MSGSNGNSVTSDDKISAYYSLAFPNFTYYLQTLNVSIGRRPIPSSNPSTSAPIDPSQIVDVDLGPLKSVSRLHARIEYEEDEERFVLVVLGRNGAWVDGVWAASGSMVPLSARSQIQIASRTFHFVLPPPPEDSVAPSSPSSEGRVRSPSVDITSVSPESAPPSPSPPPPPVKVEKPEPVLKPKVAAKKRKRSETTESAPAAPKAVAAKSLPTKPDPPVEMPLKPSLTYSVLCYRAIKALGGRGTLQEICTWMMENFLWYKLNEGSGWEGSVRHNLSSNKAFCKSKAKSEDRGKGYYWNINKECEHLFDESSGKAVGRTAGKKKEKGGAPLSEPPLKRSVAQPRAPLPPPLTNVPLPTPAATPTPPSLPPASHSNAPPANPPIANPSNPPAASASVASKSPAPNQSSDAQIPASVKLPILVKALPPDHPAVLAASKSTSTPAGLEVPPMVLDAGTLILSPVIFSSLTPEQIKELEELGAKKAIEVLQAHLVRFLKEKMASGANGKVKTKKSKKDKDKKGERDKEKDKTGGKDANAASGTATPTAATAVATSGPSVSEVPRKVDSAFTSPFPLPPGAAAAMAAEHNDEPAFKKRKVEIDVAS
ncbi:hypothetical protein SISSUDRAFT_1048154 [Sistotremastrum suecicum HHB10207 ss-3]|uniref:Fork-head domain-containing protein n=1 Tax=Sistotremastrum suecicum HHB10207 ss-3 TaxID=1314776 RepID=A0A166CMV5_9AGAM|nr:hypothetical protein SISSUDRAFT_1048154 [Sistotremastrum suecicum HHB10207 ss-3]